MVQAARDEGESPDRQHRNDTESRPCFQNAYSTERRFTQLEAGVALNWSLSLTLDA